MNDEYNKAVGQRIADSRIARKMSRAELARTLGMHETSVKRYEDGDVRNIDVEKMKKFADALDVDVIYIMGWDGEVVDVKPKDEYESQFLLLARDASKVMGEEQRTQLLENIKSTICMYISAAGLADSKDNKPTRKRRKKADDT